jgi:molybdenum cofactor cytidylyltransferase
MSSLGEASTKIAVVILAAGSSSRMGEPKQLLQVGKDSLIRKAAATALATNAFKVIVVLGHSADNIRSTVDDFPVSILINEQWAKGMGSSIKCGVSFLKENSLDAAILMTCDQPLLIADHLDALVRKFQQHKAGIVASRYNGLLGIPALFDKSLFDRLLQIDDQHGAKKVIEENLDRVLSVEFDGGSIDLDTPEDYRTYLQLIDKRGNN